MIGPSPWHQRHVASDMWRFAVVSTSSFVGFLTGTAILSGCRRAGSAAMDGAAEGARHVRRHQEREAQVSGALGWKGLS